MILFYAKEEVRSEPKEGETEGKILVQAGDVFAVADGRVHDERALQAYVTHPYIPAENVGKYIIGWIKKGEQRIESNMDKFELLKSFEDITPESPLDYRVDVETGELLKK